MKGMGCMLLIILQVYIYKNSEEIYCVSWSGGLVVWWFGELNNAFNIVLMLMYAADTILCILLF